MPGTDFQTLSNQYYSHAWNRLADTNQLILISCLGRGYHTLGNPY